jgi:hypothetical protein
MFVTKHGATLPIMEGHTSWSPDGYGKEMCPVLENPEPDCYCMNLTSLNIRKAVEYCLRDFRRCPIYKRTMGFSES